LVSDWLGDEQESLVNHSSGGSLAGSLVLLLLVIRILQFVGQTKSVSERSIDNLLKNSWKHENSCHLQSRKHRRQKVRVRRDFSHRKSATLAPAKPKSQKAEGKSEKGFFT
jgi:hypothetical protein